MPYIPQPKVGVSGLLTHPSTPPKAITGGSSAIPAHKGTPPFPANGDSSTQVPADVRRRSLERQREKERERERERRNHRHEEGTGSQAPELRSSLIEADHSRPLQQSCAPESSTPKQTPTKPQSTTNPLKKPTLWQSLFGAAREPKHSAGLREPLLSDIPPSTGDANNPSTLSTSIPPVQNSSSLSQNPDPSLSSWLPTGEQNPLTAATPSLSPASSCSSVPSTIATVLRSAPTSSDGLVALVVEAEARSPSAAGPLVKGSLSGELIQKRKEKLKAAEEGSFRFRFILERKASLLREAHVQSSMAWPMMAATFLQLLMTMTSLAFVGRLGETPLASASIATAFANVVGHIVLQGLASSLETLCGQAYGAGMPGLLGLYLQRGLLCLSAAAVPLGCVWWWAESVLLFFHQDPVIAAHAALYLRILLPSLAANVVMQCMERFLQAQGVTFPMALAAGASVAIHIPLTWLLVFHFDLGFVGAPLAVSLSFCNNLAILLLYTILSGVADESWEGFTWQAFSGWGEFMSLAVPSTAMLCLEYWGFELLTLMAGLLPNPALEVSAFQVLLNVDFLCFVFPFGFGAAVSIRVSNELGAGNPSKARDAARVGILCALAEVTVADSLLFIARNSWGRAFTTSGPVIEYVTEFVPIGLVAVFADALIAILSGIVRGCGYQHLAVYANLMAYYLIGVPIALLLGFYFDLRAWGLFLGLVIGMVIQVCFLLFIVFTTKWEDAADSARERIEEALLASEEWERVEEEEEEEIEEIEDKKEGDRVQKLAREEERIQITI